MKKAIRNIVIAIALIANGIYFIPESIPMTEVEQEKYFEQIEEMSEEMEEMSEEEDVKGLLIIVAKEFYEVMILKYGITLLSFGVLIIWILISLYKILKDRAGGHFLPITILILIVLYLISVFSESSDCEYRTLKESNGKETRYKICGEARRNLR
jgi:hypothetical protein